MTKGTTNIALFKGKNTDKNLIQEDETMVNTYGCKLRGKRMRDNIPIENLTHWLLSEETKRYNYHDMRTNIICPHFDRQAFIAMPGILRIVWDTYWTAIDMPKSFIAHRATAKTKDLFLTHISTPTNDELIDNMKAYNGLKRLQPMIVAASKLKQFNYCKVSIPNAQGHKLYDGQWVAELEAKRAEKESNVILAIVDSDNV